MDITIYIEQPTDSLGIAEKPGYISRLQKSMYATKPASVIWGSVSATTLV